jgi:protein TonB
MVSAAPRFTLALGAAGVVTFLVALMMQGLISTGGSVIEEKDFGKLVEFVHVDQDDELQTKSRQVKKPPTPPKEPPKPEMAKPDIDMTANAVDMGNMDFSHIALFCQCSEIY